MKTLKVIENRGIFYVFSVVLILIGIFAMLTYKFINGDTALNYDIDFTGGTVMKVNIGKEFNNDEIKQIVSSITKSESVQVQKVQGEQTAIIKYQVKESAAATQGSTVNAATLPVAENTTSVPVATTAAPVTTTATPETTTTTPAVTTAPVATETDTTSTTKYDNHITDVMAALSEKFGLTSANFISTEDVSPTISTEMQLNALLSVILGVIAILLYITVRFKNFKMGLASVIALVHDVLVVLAVYAVFRIPINNAFIAAILTIVGYSVNDTVVIFDRIRENKKLFPKLELGEMINKSVTETIGRSINTSLITVLVVAALFVMGESSVREFTLPLVVGIICGAYSSIANASPLWYDMIKLGEKKA